jgi:hypothetical protein
MSSIPEYVKDYLDRFPQTTGAELSRALHIPGRSARRYVKNYKSSKRFTSVDDRREVLREYLGTTYSPAPPKRNFKEITIAAVGDFHGQPDPRIISELVKCNADIYVFGGDTFDQAQASRWPSETKKQANRRKQESCRDEIAEMRVVIETLLEETDGEIHILLGNHDVRVLKRILEVFPDWVLNYYKDPMELLCDGLEDRVQLVGKDIDLRFPNGEIYATGMHNEFVYVLGDVLFSHMNFSSSRTEPAVSKLYRMWFTDWERSLNLRHINVIVHFHVHQRTMMSVAGGHLLLIEPGMGGMAETENYKYDYNAKWRPSVRGFLVFKQVDGVTDPESIQLVAPYLTKF